MVEFPNRMWREEPINVLKKIANSELPTTRYMGRPVCFLSANCKPKVLETFIPRKKSVLCPRPGGTSFFGVGGGQRPRLKFLQNRLLFLVLGEVGRHRLP